MEIRFYTQDMGFIGVMENQTSLIWTRKFYEPGNASLFAPLTNDNLALTQIGNLIWMKGRKEAAVIEDRTITESQSKAQIEINGRFLSSYMDRRLIRPKVTFDGTVEAGMRQLLTGAEPITRVELGELNDFPETVSFQATYKNLLEYETKLARCSNIGFRFRPDFDGKRIIFETYKGVDRSRSQGVNHRVIFSESYDNLNEMSFRQNEQLMKNVFYVCGKGQNDADVVVTYGDATGLERREMYVDAGDITLEDGMTNAQLREKLTQRAMEKAKEYERSESISSMTDANANFVYRTDYDLGDVVTVMKKKWGIYIDLRITEIAEIYERGVMKVSPVFGSVLPETIDWGDR